jgi:hypothetical protein
MRFCENEPIVSIFNPEDEVFGDNEINSRVKYLIFLRVGTIKRISFNFPSLIRSFITESISILSIFFFVRIKSDNFQLNYIKVDNFLDFFFEKHFRTVQMQKTCGNKKLG